MKKMEYGRWACIDKSNNEYLGWCGLKLNEQDMVDIGFRFFRKYWGKGYATESAKACLEYGFEELEIKEIIGRVAKDNIASIRVLEKLKMEYWKEDLCNNLDAIYYRISILER